MVRRRVVVVALLAGCGHSPQESADASVSDADAAVGSDASSDAATPAALFASSPPQALAGAVVYLEGDFERDPIVTFPSGVTAPATILGAHRATVVVPANAGDGALSVMQPGGASTPVPFYGMAMGLGLHQVTTDAQTGGAHVPPDLTGAVSRIGGVRLGNWVYAIGGYKGSITGNVERARINADGSLGAFANVPNVSLHVPRQSFATVVIGQYLYVLGGNAPTHIAALVERAPIGADGTLGAFESAGQLTTERNEPAAVVVGDRLCAIGGATSTFLTTIECATINSDGSLGAFAVQQGTLVRARAGAQAIAVGNALYVIGGGAGFNALRTVEMASIAPDGTIGAFSELQDVALYAGRYDFQTLVLGNWLYAIGGAGDDSSDDRIIERAPIHDDFTIGPFAPTGVFLPTTRSGIAAVVANRYVYVYGGGQRDVLQFSIDADDQVATATTGAATLALATQDHALVTIGTSLYVIGGKTAATTFTASLQRAQVSWSKIGPFTLVTNSALVTPRAGFATLTAGGYLYVIGGMTDSGATASIERAQILDDDTLGPFATFSQSLVTPRAYAVAVALRDQGAASRFYVIGGSASDGTAIGSVEVASFLADGSLGSFTTSTRSTLAKPRYMTGVAVIYGAVYLTGGRDKTTELGDVERAWVDSYGLNAFGAVGTLTIPRVAPVTAVVGDHLFVAGGIDVGYPQASAEMAVIQNDATIGGFSTVPGFTLVTARAASAAAIVANALYLVGGRDYFVPLGSVERAALY